MSRRNSGSASEPTMASGRGVSATCAASFITCRKSPWPSAHPKRGIYCLPEYASKIDKIRKIDDQDTENNSKSSDLTNLIDLTGGTATTPLRKIGHGVAEPEIVATEGVVNGFAISATPEDRKPPETGPLTARVTLRIVRSPAASPQHARRCAQCHGEPDGLELLHMVSGEPTWLHRECARFFRPPVGDPPEAA